MLKVYLLFQQICLDFIETPCSFIVKKEASETLKKLIKLFKDKVIKLYEIVDKYKGWYN